MAVNIGPKIGIDGEKEYRDSISSIITQMKTLSSEMKLVTSEFEENADSQEALTKKNEILNKQIETQKKRLELLNKMLEESTKKYGETDSKTLKWRQSVNYAQIELNGLKSELSDNIKKLNDTDSSLDDVTKSLKNAGEEARDTSGDFTIMKGAMADLAADGVREIASSAKDMVSSFEDANTKLQGQTGTTAKEMSKYKDIMDEIYQEGYGEDIEGVADALAKVKQQAGDIDPSQLKEMTKYALDLEQTFGYDVSESIRTVNNLMKTFGISAEEAFDMIVSGAQNGLDQNGNLLDTFNEYGPKFKSIGMDAQDMYNALESGAKSGIFDMDKLGDAVNEFSIRVLDGSDTTKDAFKRMGLDADDMADKFAQGGDTARNAFKQTMKALEGIEDPLERNTVGVELFGTMWEDTGGQAILALGDIQDGVNNTKGAIQELDQVNSDNLNSKFSALGRTIQTEIVGTILEDAYPAIEEIVDFTAENIDEIIPLAKAAGVAITGMFVVNKASQFIDSVNNVTGAIKNLTSATKERAAMDTAADLASVGSAKGIAKVTGAIGEYLPLAGVLIGVGGTMVSMWKDTTDSMDELAEKTAFSQEGLIGMSAGVNTFSESMMNATGYLDSFNTTMFASAEEQQNLVANMQQVQEGITTICQTATAERRGYTQEEITQLDQYFQQLNALQDQQYQIEVEKMNAISQAAAGYAENQNMTYAQYQETAANWITTAQQQKDTMLAMIDDQTIQEIALLNQRYGQEATMSNTAYANEYNALMASAEQKKQGINQSMTDMYTAYANGYTQIMGQTELFDIHSKEQYASLQEAMDVYTATISGIQQKYGADTKEAQDHMTDLNARYRDNLSTIWADVVRNMDEAEGSQLASWLGMVADAQMNGAQLDEETSILVDTLIKTFADLPKKTKSTVKDTIQPMLDGLRSNAPELYSAAQTDGNSVINALEDALEVHSPSRATRRIFQNVGEGMKLGLKDKESSVTSSARNLAYKAVKSLDSYDAYGNSKIIGGNIAIGMANGIIGGSSSVIDAAANMAYNALKAAKNALGIHSPSKEFEDEIGKNAALGLVKGFDRTLNLNTGEMIKNMKMSLDTPDLSGYKISQPIYTQTVVYLGNEKLIDELSGGVSGRIGENQKNSMAAKGRRVNVRRV